MLLTSLIQSIRVGVLTFFTCKTKGALGHRVHIIGHVTALGALLSVSYRAGLSALRSWVCCVTNNHVAVDKYKWVVSNKLECFQAKPLGTR